MRDYGVGGPDWRPLPWAWAADRLTSASAYWVATASAAARPHVTPVWGVWAEPEHRCVFSCAPSSRTATNLGDNPLVTIAPDGASEVVMVEGRADRVTGTERLELWIDLYLAKYRSLAPDLSREFIRDNALFEVVPERAIGVIERAEEFATPATRWTF